MLIVRQARNYLRKNRVDQWQGEYPDEKAFIDAIVKGECHVMLYGERVAGVFCLSDKPEPCYDAITDGKWRCEGRYCTLHRAAVSADFRGTGMSDMLISQAERLAREMGAESVRVDTHRKNKAMQGLLKRMGYNYRGNVLVSSEPGHDPARQGFEKAL